MRVFVTGATGFVGQAISRHLIDAGHTVTALLLPDEAVPASLLSPEVQIARGDITLPASLDLSGHDAVIHLAGAVGYGQSWDVCERVNVAGTRHVAQAALAADIRRFVHMSSVSVYGRVPDVPLTEDAPMRRTNDPYGDTKIDAEHIVRTAEVGGATLHWTILRPTVIYGPGDRKFLPVLRENVQSGRARIIGRGDNTVDLVHVDDVASFVVDSLGDERTYGEVFNVTNPPSLTWSELVALVADGVGVERPRGHVPYRVALGLASLMELSSRVTRRPPRLTRYAVRVIGRQYRYVISRAQRVGFEPQVDLRSGIQACLGVAS